MSPSTNELIYLIANLTPNESYNYQRR